MANGGPNSNGSQFFINVLPTVSFSNYLSTKMSFRLIILPKFIPLLVPVQPWLDNKHTVFGRAVKGMEVIQNICNSKTNPKTDKPYDDIKIISIQLS